LTELDLRCDEIEPVEIKWTKMKQNEWTVNEIGLDGAGMISEALKCNSSLTVLDLSGDEIQSIVVKWRNEANEWIENEIETEGAGMISEALKCNSSLTQLNLSGDEMNQWNSNELKWSKMSE